MPRVIGYTPSWLSRPSPGAKIFSDPEPQSPVSPSKRSSYIRTETSVPQKTIGPRRIIASRGTEIFTVVGNKLRWADLSRVQDDWEEKSHSRTPPDEKEAYRTLVTPVYYQITQLIISPSETFLAICTEHTVHVAVLPDSSRLVEGDRSPLKLKTYQLGPTTHVIPESPLASVLWHPLAASTTSSDCLVTVTTEAAVRIWEIDRANHWSFERPALAIDLRKLADGVSSDQDYEPSGFGKNRGFSVDAFDMEAAAACFGGRGVSDEDGWAGMTLWTAMSNGDVYALCPLLPSKWRPTTTTIPALSISAVSNMTTLPNDADADECKAAEQQYEWVQELDTDDLVVVGMGDDEILYRPQNPSAIPRLQGPFELSSVEDFDDGEVTDIYVMAARLDEESLLSGEEDYELATEGLQFTIVCLNTAVGQTMVSMELEGISGQWLPKKGRSTFSVPTSEARELVLLEQIATGPSFAITSDTWLMFSANINDPYSVYVTTSDSIRSISLSDWASRVGMEVYGEGEVDSGLQTRLAVACQGTICVAQELLTVDSQASASSSALSAPAQISGHDIGQMLVSSVDGQACAVVLDSNVLDQSVSSIAQTGFTTLSRSTGALSKVLEEELPDPVPTRAPYPPADIFYHNQMRPFDDLRQKIPANRRNVMTDKPVRLSPACLDIMTLAHRTFSSQTSNIEKAAAELFRRCERLREELADQVKQMSELADRLQHVNAATENDDGKKVTFEERISAAQEKQKLLSQRYEALRRKSGRAGLADRELSKMERVWIEEVETLGRKVGIDETQDQQASDSMSERYAVVRSLGRDLLEQSQSVTETPASTSKPETSRSGDGSPFRQSGLSISTRMQRERVAEVMAMVEREGAIIDAVMSRLNKLSVG